MRDFLTDRLAQKIQGQIMNGGFRAGEKLPSLRESMRIYQCSKNTVIYAYEKLIANNLVEPRRGAGYFVRGTPGARENSNHWAPAVSRALREYGLEAPDEFSSSYSWADGLPPGRWLESCRLDRYMQKISRLGLGSAFRYGDPMGYPSLRRHICLRMATIGLECDASQILLTQGASQAVDIVIRRYIRPGESVLIDSPTYFLTIKKIQLQGAVPVGVQRTANGPDVEQLRLLARQTGARFFFTQSLAHNPTGSDISKEVAFAVLECARQLGLTIVEQDALGDYKPYHAPRLSSLDGLQNTIHIGTFTKSLSSLMRIGFIVCHPRLVQDLLEVKTITTVNSTEFAERAVDAIITEDRYSRHLAQLQQRARQSTALALHTLDSLGAEIFTRPAETLYLWVRFPGVSDSVCLARAMIAEGVYMMPGTVFYPDRRTIPWLRCNVGSMAEHPQKLEPAANALRRQIALLSATGKSNCSLVDD